MIGNRTDIENVNIGLRQVTASSDNVETTAAIVCRSRHTIHQTMDRKDVVKMTCIWIG